MNAATQCLLGAAFAALVASPANAQPVVAAVATEFKAMDANGDGKVSREEHAAGARSMFETMDANKDGKVTSSEMERAHRAIAGRDPGKDDLSAAEKIKAVDQDADGALTAAEHGYASRTMFDKMDINRDGALTPEEMAAGHAAMLKK